MPHVGYTISLHDTFIPANFLIFNTMTHTLMIFGGNASMRVLLVAMAVEYAGVVLAVLADFFSGVAKARRAGIRRTSGGYRRTFDKLARYLTALAGLTLVDAVILAAVVCLRATGGSSLPLLPVMTTLGAVGMALVEAKSICERVEDKGDLHRAASLLEELARLLTSKFRRQ